MRSGMMQLGEIATVSQHGANTNVMLRARDAKKLALAKREVEKMLERAASTIKYLRDPRPLTAKTGVRVP
jgi:hypothetical protein